MARSRRCAVLGIPIQERDVNGMGKETTVTDRGS